MVAEAPGQPGASWYGRAFCSRRVRTLAPAPPIIYIKKARRVLNIKAPLSQPGTRVLLSVLGPQWAYVRRLIEMRSEIKQNVLFWRKKLAGRTNSILNRPEPHFLRLSSQAKV